MNNFFNNLQQEAENIKLSQNEKQAMRVALYRAMETTARVEQARKTLGAARAVRSPYVWFSPRLAVPVAAVLVGVLGTGTAYASQAALPGDALYTIKVNVTEPAMGALALGDEAKAQWHAEVAETRLEEAEVLAAEGRLDAKTSAQLVENFDTHSNQAVVLAQKIESEEPGTGIEIAAQIDSSLEAHDVILAKVGEVSDESKKFTDTVALKVRERGSVTLALGGAGTDPAADASMAMTMQTDIQPLLIPAEPEPAASTTDAKINAKARTTVIAENSTTSIAAQSQTQAKVVAKLKKSSNAALVEAKKLYNSVKKSLGATTTAQIEADFARISATVEAAASKEALTSALKETTTLKAFLKASKNLKRNLFTPESRSWGSSKKEDKKEDKNEDTNSAATTTVRVDIKTTVDAVEDKPHATSSEDNRGRGSDDVPEDKDDSFLGKLIKNL